MTLPERAQRYAETPEFQRLWRKIHAHLEANGGQVVGSVTMGRMTIDEKLAIGLMLGVRPRGEGMRVELKRVNQALSKTGADLVTLVTAAVGPIRDRPAERAEKQSARDDRWGAVRSHPAVGRHPVLLPWAQALKLRAANWAHLLSALDVLATLPAPEPVSRGRLAAVVLGDSHGLDDGRVAANLTLSGWSAVAGMEAPMAAASRREAWRSAGVSVDESSSTVLALRLAPDEVGPVTAAGRAWGATGLVVPLTLAMVTAEPWRVAPGTVVRVCENPSVIEAAAALATSVSMVCVAGNPSLAARRLLESLRQAGADLRYHGDFGTGGIAIGNVVIGELGATPWRFKTADFQQAFAAHGETGLPPIRGTVPAATWDPDLGPAIAEAGVEVQEEHVLPDLILDLSAI